MLLPLISLRLKSNTLAAQLQILLTTLLISHKKNQTNLKSKFNYLINIKIQLAKFPLTGTKTNVLPMLLIELNVDTTVYRKNNANQKDVVGIHCNKGPKNHGVIKLQVNLI